MFIKIFPEKECDFYPYQLAFVKQLISNFADYNAYNATVGLQDYNTFSRFIIDCSGDLNENVIEVEGSKSTMVALFEEFSEKIGAINSVRMSSES